MKLEHVMQRLGDRVAERGDLGDAGDGETAAFAAEAVDSVPVTTRVAAAIVTRVRRTRVDMRMGGLLDDVVEGAIAASRRRSGVPVSGADLIPQDRSCGERYTLASPRQ